MKIEISDKLVNRFKEACYCDVHDISSHIEHLIESKLSIDIDDLTGFQTRWSFISEVNMQILRKRSQSKILFNELFLCIDIDRLVDLLDYHGHLSGDEVLISVSKTLRNRYPNNRLCRWGGDEFVVWLKDNDTRPINLDDELCKKYRDIGIKRCVVDFSINDPESSNHRILHWVECNIDLGMIKASINGDRINCGNPPKPK